MYEGVHGRAGAAALDPRPGWATAAVPFVILVVLAGLVRGVDASASYVIGMIAGIAAGSVGARTYGPADEPNAVPFVFHAEEDLGPEETAHGFGDASATPRKVVLGSEEGHIIKVPEGYAVVGLPDECVAATVVAAHEGRAIRLATALIRR